MKFITFKDRVVLHVEAGKGGDGMASFRREKFVPKGGPNGGDGGRGGHVSLVGDPNENSLLDLYYRPHQRAEHGGRGGSKDCHGRNGADLVVKVPCGTVVTDRTTGELLGEIVSEGEQLQVAQGGRGGMGNRHFASPTHRAPIEFTPGAPGEKLVLRLELKLVADAGLVGYPNAGKSTLIRRLTKAHPKVAPYPFTTLNPVIGTIQFDDYKTLRLADIPGLIDGAHDGIGLGHDFLRHIERTDFLLFVIDMGGVDGRHPADDYLNLREELRLYREELDQRPFVVLANKMDLPEAELYLEEFVERTGVDPVQISAEQNQGVEQVRDLLYRNFYGAPGTAPVPDEPLDPGEPGEDG